jgi:hypothetical protein
MTILHHGQKVVLQKSRPAEHPYPRLKAPPPVSPPRGRAPLREGVGADANAPSEARPHRRASETKDETTKAKTSSST